MKKQALIFCLLCLPLFAYAQDSGVIPYANNFLYRGVESPIKVIAEDYSCESLYVTANMNLKRLYGCDYYVTPMNQNTGIFRIHVLREGDTVFIGQHIFRLLTTPDPVAKIEGSYDGRISIGLLNRARRITADLDDFIYDVDFKIKSFTALIENGDSLIYKEDITGEIFTATLKLRFYEIHTLDRVIFENIKALGPSNIEREIDPLILTIR